MNSPSSVDEARQALMPVSITDLEGASPAAGGKAPPNSSQLKRREERKRAKFLLRATLAVLAYLGLGTIVCASAARPQDRLPPGAVRAGGSTPPIAVDAPSTCVHSIVFQPHQPRIRCAHLMYTRSCARLPPIRNDVRCARTGTYWGGLDALQAAYLVVVTLTTVGYGDLTTQGEEMHLFAVGYILIGVVLAATALGHIVGAILDKQERLLTKALEESAHKLNESGATYRSAVSNKGFAVRLQPAWMSDAHYKVTSSVFIFILFVATGVVVFMVAQDLTFVQALYLVIVSAATVGYGDFAPNKPSTRLFSIFFLPLASLSLAKAVGDWAEARNEEKQRLVRDRILQRKLDVASIGVMDTNGDNRIERHEFLAAVLVEQGKVTREEIAAIMARFSELDVDGDGDIDEDDVRAAM